MALKFGPARLYGSALVLAAVLAIEVGSQAAPPASDSADFVARVRAALRTDEELQSQYTYLEHRREVKVTKLGKVTAGDERVFEVYPSAEPGRTYKRLIRINGVPVSAAELQARDEARRKWVADEIAKRAHEIPSERLIRQQKALEERRKRDEIVDDVFRTFDVKLVGRERVAGVDTIVASLTPRDGVTPRSRPGKYFPSFRGRAWVTESDYQVIKVDLEAIRDVLVGWGFMGRIYEGSRLTYERTRVNDEIWLPARMRMDMTGRALLLRKFKVEAVTEYSDYKKFAVDTRETFALPR